MHITQTSGRVRPASGAMTAALAGLLGLALAMGVGRFAFTPILPLMQRDAGVSIVDGAWLGAANYLGYLMGALAAFAVGARASAAIRAALVATAAATVAMGFTHSMPAWIALRWAAGFASAFLLIFIAAWALERVASRPVLGGTIFSGVGAGIFVVGVACIALEAGGATSAHVWTVLGAASFAAAAILWPVFAAGPAPAARSSVAAPKGSWRLVAGYGLFGFGYIIPATFLPVMGKAAGAEWMVSLAWPAFGLAAFVSTYAAARLADRLSSLSVWRLAQVAMAAGVALPTLGSSPVWIVASGAVVGGTFMVVTMLGMQTARAFGGADPRRLMAAMTASFATGQLLGPLVVPFVVGAAGDFDNVLLLAMCALLASELVIRSAEDIGTT